MIEDMEPGMLEWQGQLQKSLSEEEKRPVRWFYLSFSGEGEDGFLGGAIVEAPGPVHAIVLAHALEINPGGQVMAVPVGKEVFIPKEAINRLLQKGELERLFGELVRLK